jgi:hypothetical protein
MDVTGGIGAFTCSNSRFARRVGFGGAYAGIVIYILAGCIHVTSIIEGGYLITIDFITRDRPRHSSHISSLVWTIFLK